MKNVVLILAVTFVVLNQTATADSKIEGKIGTLPVSILSNPTPEGTQFRDSARTWSLTISSIFSEFTKVYGYVSEKSVEYTVVPRPNGSEIITNAGDSLSVLSNKNQNVEHYLGSSGLSEINVDVQRLGDLSYKIIGTLYDQPINISINSSGNTSWVTGDYAQSEVSLKIENIHEMSIESSEPLFLLFFVF